MKGGVVNSVRSSLGKVDDDLIEGKFRKFECEIPTQRILSTYFIFWLVCLNNTHDK